MPQTNVLTVHRPSLWCHVQCVKPKPNATIAPWLPNPLQEPHGWHHRKFRLPLRRQEKAVSFHACIATRDGDASVSPPFWSHQQSRTVSVFHFDIRLVLLVHVLQQEASLEVLVGVNDGLELCGRHNALVLGSLNLVLVHKLEYAGRSVLAEPRRIRQSARKGVHHTDCKPYGTCRAPCPLARPQARPCQWRPCSAAVLSGSPYWNDGTGSRVPLPSRVDAPWGSFGSWRSCIRRRGDLSHHRHRRTHAARCSDTPCWIRRPFCCGTLAAKTQGTPLGWGPGPWGRACIADGRSASSEHPAVASGADSTYTLGSAARGYRCSARWSPLRRVPCRLRTGSLHLAWWSSWRDDRGWALADHPRLTWVVRVPWAVIVCTVSLFHTLRASFHGATGSYLECPL